MSFGFDCLQVCTSEYLSISSLSLFEEAVFWYWVFDERSIIGHCRRFQSPMKMLSSGLSRCLSFRICSKKGTIFDSFGPYREKMLRV